MSHLGVTGYRLALVDMLTEPGQIALEAAHAGDLVGQIEDVLDAAGYEIAPKAEIVEQRRPTVFWPTHTMADRELAAGVVIQRYTESGRGGMVWAEMPCCPRWVHLKVDTEQEFAVRCQPCGMDYTAGLVSESDGGYLAVFTIVVDEAPIPSRSRPNARRIR